MHLRFWLVRLILLFHFPVICAGQKSIGVSKLLNTKGRIALLIGNKNYRFIPGLSNTERDVDSMASVLYKIGFQVSSYKNLDLDSTRKVMAKFSKELNKEKTEVALVYFSGHGLGLGSTNYLLPVNTQLNCVEQLRTYESVSLNKIVEDVLLKEIKHNIFFVDACRDLPDLAHCDGTPAQTGLSKPPESYRGSLISFAAKEGTTADDNLYDKVNSLFTSELIKYLALPNIGIRTILDLVDSGVYTRSNKKQDPIRWDRATEDYVFVKKGEASGKVGEASSKKNIEIIAFKPDGKQLDFELAKLAIGKLKLKFPEYNFLTANNSKSVVKKDVFCTIMRKTVTSKNPVTIGDETYNLVKADTQLRLIFKDGKQIIDEIEVSGRGTDHDIEAAITISIEQTLEKLSEKSINIKN